MHNTGVVSDLQLSYSGQPQQFVLVKDERGGE